MKYFVGAVAISLSLAGCGVGSADDFAGEWKSTDSSLDSSIVLDKRRKFRPMNFRPIWLALRKLAATLMGTASGNISLKATGFFWCSHQLTARNAKLHLV
ncbi:hypothetical protein J5226_20635 [Lysobacter sp. K5869]|uniref:hypothetical protein n=1 Tax=Lysobacter sp. K5869 TaxID=2820808 RepID=UPI001C05F786|nr:hypothetical protein [Lysobacter sp. K5869]QWP75984.1 hypothetical protein J5226_20635 [Lysobacter sp. K5869]